MVRDPSQPVLREGALSAPSKQNAVSLSLLNIHQSFRTQAVNTLNKPTASTPISVKPGVKKKPQIYHHSHTLGIDRQASFCFPKFFINQGNSRYSSVFITTGIRKVVKNNPTSTAVQLRKACETQPPSKAHTWQNKLQNPNPMGITLTCCLSPPASAD